MIYARQVRPEYQESPLDIIDEWPEDVVLAGNHCLNTHTIPLYNRFMEYWEEAFNELESIKNHDGYNCYQTTTEAILCFFPPEHKQKYSTKEIHQWKSILAEMCYREDEATICKALQLMTGKVWDYTQIHGCCQRDWQGMIYCTENWNQEARKAFEIEYFNLGTEWIIHDGDNVPDSPEDICGFSIYCATWDEDETRRIIADAANVDPVDVVMYAYDGDVITAKYRIA